MEIAATSSYSDNNRESGNDKREILRLNNLDALITALFICKENYEDLAIATDVPGFKFDYTRYAAERVHFAATLYINLSQYGALSVDENGNISGGIWPGWRQASPCATVYDEDTLLRNIINHELEAIKRYDTYLRNHIPIIKDLNLLVGQRDAIKQAVKELK